MATKTWTEMLEKTKPELAPPVEKENSRKRYTNYGVILYPDCLEHMDMLKYLETHTYQFQIVYILHDQDVWDEDGDDHKKGDPKKAHYHVGIHLKEGMTPSSFVKFFSVWINYAEKLTSMSKYIMYMLHDTPDSMHKHQYSADLLKGDKKLIKSAVQNGHYV